MTTGPASAAAGSPFAVDGRERRVTPVNKVLLILIIMNPEGSSLFLRLEFGVFTVPHACHERVITMCLENAGSASCSSLLIFSLSLSGVRRGVKPGVTGPRGVITPPGCGVMPSCP